ncbi:MAG: hypothetical protein Q9190_002132 [Brigantiaea leucoxantha]
MTATSDLLNHYRIDAICHPDYVIHTSYVSRRARNVQTMKVEKKWENVKAIGWGSFGEVLLQQSQNEERAVKVLRKKQMEKEKIDYKRELEALAAFDKSNIRQTELIVHFYGWFESDDLIYLAMEYFPLGDLSEFISAGEIQEEDAKQIATDLLIALEIIHTEGFTHRDLKPQNIFVVQKKPEWRVKIGDFGITKRINDRTSLRTETGTPNFTAPEVQPEHYSENHRYTNAVDIWSLGCVVYVMIAQCPPFRGIYAKRHPFPQQPLKGRASSDLISFLESTLVLDPLQRLTAQSALDHSWLHNSQPENPISLDAQVVHRGTQESQLFSNNAKNRLGTFSISPNLDQQNLARSKAKHTTTLKPQTAQNETQDNQGSPGHGKYKLPSAHGPRRFESVSQSSSLFLEQIDHHSGFTQAEYTSKLLDGLFKSNFYLPFTHEVTIWKKEIDCQAVANFLMQRKINVNNKDSYGNPALVVAAHNGLAVLVRVLLKANASIEDADRRGRTALHAASERNNDQVVNLLMGAGAQPNTQGRRGQTPLNVAIKNRSFKAAEALLEGGASPSQANVVDDDVPLFLAVTNSQEIIVRLLLQHGASPNQQTIYDGQTALHWSISYNDVAIAQLLIDCGADIDCPDKNGDTPLHIAAKKSKKTTKLLIQAGACIDLWNKNGDTPLLVAAEQGLSMRTTLLIKAGADLYVAGSKGKAAWHFLGW